MMTLREEIDMILSLALNQDGSSASAVRRPRRRKRSISRSERIPAQGSAVRHQNGDDRR